MNKSFLRIMFFALIMSTFLFQACSVKLAKKDLDSVEKLKVVRYKTPDLEVKTTTGVVLNLVGGGAIVPTLIAAHVDKKTSGEATQGTIMPDYGKLLMKNFMEIARKEIPGWPKMTPVYDPVDKGYEYKGDAFILFDVDHMWITLIGGIAIEGDVVMKNSNGDNIFKTHFFYRSMDYGLRKSQDEYVADNCKQLIAEIPLAAEHTARDIIIKKMKESL